MTRHYCKGPGCGRLLQTAGTRGGRPRLYCSERCRSRSRRLMARIERGLEGRQTRSDTVSEHRHLLRAAAYAAASQARRLAAQLDTQPAPSNSERPTPRAADRPPATTARHTRAALAVLDETLTVLAAAVATDRAAGDDWTAIGTALGVSADTASRRYSTNPNRP